MNLSRVAGYLAYRYLLSAPVAEDKAESTDTLRTGAGFLKTPQFFHFVLSSFFWKHIRIIDYL